MGQQGKNIYVHIGWPKTGTKTIQDGLVENEQILLQNGYLYPKTGRLGNVHYNIAFQLQEDPRFKPKRGTINDLVCEIGNSTQHKIIISSEEFINLKSKQVGIFSNYLSHLGNVYIIAYLRRQDLLLQSLWTQSVKRGLRTEGFGSFLEERLIYDPFPEVLQRWSEAFDQGNIRVRILEKIQLKGHLFQDFLQTCDIDNVHDFKVPESRNVSPTIKELEILRYLFDKFRDSYYPGLIPDGFFDKAIRSFAESRGWELSEHPNLISIDLYKKIRNSFRESNRRIARLYLQQNRLFHEPYKDKPITTFDVSKLPVEDVLDMMAYLISRLLSLFAEERGDRRTSYMLSKLREENEILRKQLHSIRSSRGWKLLDKIRKTRASLVPWIQLPSATTDE